MIQQLSPLPKKPAMPAAGRTLESIVLPGDLADQVRRLLDEWAQSEKLLRYGMQPRNRILLHGPPGNGKTVLAEAIATELALPFQVIAYSDVVSSHLGKTNTAITSAFRSHGCAVLFFDECDSLLNRRSEGSSGCDKANNSFVNTILMELDRLPASVVVVFATNFAQVLDPAFTRRVNITLEMPAPDVNDLTRLLRSLQERHPLWPIGDFDAATCGAKSFAACEQLVLDHARRKILDPQFDPLNLAGKPRSQWLREQIAQQRRDGGAVPA